MDSDEEWIVLGPGSASDSDDARVIALSSSSCGSTPAASDDDDDSDDDDLEAGGDDGDGFGYELEEVPPRAPPLHAPLSGFFQSDMSGAASYAAFDVVRAGAKQLILDPAFSAFPEKAAVMASAGGLLCLRGLKSGLYYVSNPATFTRECLPRHGLDHCTWGDPAVVIAFDGDKDDGGHYHVVVAFNICDGVYGFETFSSRTWKWRASSEVCAVEHLVSESGVGALSRAFWRTTIGYVLCYDPAADRPDTIFAPHEVERLPLWELGEMEGKLCVTCMDERVGEVMVFYLDDAMSCLAGGGSPWAWAAHFDSCKLRKREGVSLLRSQGAAEVVMCDPRAQVVVAMDLEGRTSRTIGSLPTDCNYYSASFVPYVLSPAAAIKPPTEAAAKNSSEQTGKEKKDKEFGSCGTGSKAFKSAIPSSGGGMLSC